MPQIRFAALPRFMRPARAHPNLKGRETCSWNSYHTNTAGCCTSHARYSQENNFTNQLHLQIILKNPLRSLGVVQGRSTPYHCVWRTAAWHAGQAYKHRFSVREFLSNDLFPKSWWQNCQIAGRYGLSCFITFPIDCAIRPLSSLEKYFHCHL